MLPTFSTSIKYVITSPSLYFPSFAFAKANDGKYNEGEVITYLIEVENVGNISLQNFEFEDDFKNFDLNSDLQYDQFQTQILYNILSTQIQLIKTVIQQVIHLRIIWNMET